MNKIMTILITLMLTSCGGGDSGTSGGKNANKGNSNNGSSDTNRPNSFTPPVDNNLSGPRV